MYSFAAFTIWIVTGKWWAAAPVLILALKEGLKAVLHIFKAGYGDTHLCARSCPHTSSVERGILNSVALMVQVWYLPSSALENTTLSGYRGTACSAANRELVPSWDIARWRGRRQVWGLQGEAGSEHTAPCLRETVWTSAERPFSHGILHAGWGDIFLTALELAILLIPVPVVWVCILFCCWSSRCSHYLPKKCLGTPVTTKQ